MIAAPGQLASRPRDRFDIVPVAKSGANPFSDRISIGRARNCDIILRHPSVSKLHARFRVGASLEIVDVGSVNGTSINGRRLDPNRPAQLRVHDTIQLGTLQAILVDSAALYELLRAS